MQIMLINKEGDRKFCVAQNSIKVKCILKKIFHCKEHGDYNGTFSS